MPDENFRGFNGGIEKDDQRIRTFFSDGYDCLRFDNTLSLDRKKFIARCLSSSYSLKEDDSGYDQYIRAVNELFDKYESNGTVAIPNESVVYTGIMKWNEKRQENSSSNNY